MAPPDFAFDALVAAYEPGPGGLRSLVPVAGRALVEHQLRRAQAAGAERLLLLVEEMPVALAETIAALRREGAVVLPCAGLDVAAEALVPDRPVLLIADACLPPEPVLTGLAHRPGPCLATLPDAAEWERFERIDGDTRWAGVALLDGARVAEAAAMLGSWDPVSTLLRRAVQEEASRLDVADAPPLLLLDPDEAAAVEAGIVAAARARPRSWAERWFSLPPARMATPLLVRRSVASEWLVWPAAGLAIAAAALALAGWRWPALAALLFSFPIAATGWQLARVADELPRFGRLARAIEPAGAALAAVGLAAQIYAASHQWGWWLVLLLLLAGASAMPHLRVLASERSPGWMPRHDALAWAIVPFALAGQWDAGLAALCLYALIGAGFLLKRVLPVPAADAGLPPPKLF